MRNFYVLFACCLVNILPVFGFDYDELKFPQDFMFGVSTSAYQIEGAWNKGGKSESIWDRLTHQYPELVAHSFNADDAANSYYLYKRDVEMLKELGVNFYRFSISWPRILPTGRSDFINRKGIIYYNKLINELLKFNITPMATLYHWDMPQVLEDEGGFLNSSFPLVFEEYARVAFEEFGDRVKYWTTINEPDEICVQGYGMKLRAPLKDYHGYGEYICAANLLAAHARAYHLYNNTYKPIQKGIIGISVGIQWSEPHTNTEADKMAAEDALQFHVGLFTHPIYSAKGGYPEEVKKRIPKERLGDLPSNVEIRGTSDFIGLNHYDVYYAHRNTPRPSRNVPSFDSDLDINTVYVRRWSQEWLKMGPSCFGKVLQWIKKNCNDPVIFVTESGFGGNPGLDDRHRVWYYRRYLLEVLSAIRAGINVKTYSPWSLMDNFEWLRGYADRYGLYEVDFDDTKKTRTPRRSAFAYKRIIETRIVDPDYMNEIEWEQGKKMKNLSLYRFLPTFDRSPSLEKVIRNGNNATGIQLAIAALNSQLLTFNRPFDYSFVPVSDP